MKKHPFYTNSMKGLNLITVVFGLTCLNVHGHPVWNEQKGCLEDTISFFDYNAMKDKELLRKLVKNEGNLHSMLRGLTLNLDDSTMNFIGNLQGLNHLLDEVSISGTLKEKLGYDKISAPTAIYIYQIMFSEEDEDLGKSFDEYVKGMITDPFVNEE